MASSFRERYHRQLPGYRRWTLEKYVGAIGSFCSMASIVALWKWDNIEAETKTFLLIILLMCIASFLMLILYIRHRRGLERYAQSVFFVHYVNHCIRDFLGELRIGKHPQLRPTLNDILTSIATCFSILVGRQCRCSVKEITIDDNKHQLVKTVARDTISETFSETSSIDDKLNDNTDFYSLWKGQDGCVRYFLCNDLVRLWKRRKYRNSSFLVVGDPEPREFLWFNWVSNWRLPYKSSIVWPIRFIHDYSYWPPRERQGLNSNQSQPHFWGFLCVDCHTAHAFDSVHCPELGGAFADALYTLLTHIDETM